MGVLKHDLANRGADLIETHISWVFLSDQDVWKVKKPVALGFLDFSSLERRKEACEAEVRLNRRLAGDVYLGVVPVTRDAAGAYALAGGGEVVDWAVHMRRLSDDRRADMLLADRSLTVHDIEHVAGRIADFHTRVQSDERTARFGSPEVIRQNVTENFVQSRVSIAAYLKAGQADEIERRQTDFLKKNRELFERRVHDGHIRDGHGDLRLEHIYLDHTGGMSILDCIEFNERFRFADVAADVAFLSMDFAWHGRVDLAEIFLATYARDANDYDLYPLIDFYESYRAYVRGKVTSMLAGDASAAWPGRERAAHEARRYYLLALATERRPLLRPILVAVGGLIASGKSTVAHQLSVAMAAPVVGTDRTRKWLSGVDSTHSLQATPWQGAYSPKATRAVYAEVLRRASKVLHSGRPVIIDASFRSRTWRAEARALAGQFNAEFVFVECIAPSSIRTERLRLREEQATVSDGRADLDHEFRDRWEPVGEIGRDEYITVNTAEDLNYNIDTLRQTLPMWPPTGP